MDFSRRYLRQLCCVILVLAGQSIQAEEEWFSDRMLRKLYDRSDLIIDATILEDVNGGMGGGGVPVGDWRWGYISCASRVRVHEVLKGAVDLESPLLINVTLPQLGKGEWIPVPLNEPIPVQGPTKPLLSKGDRAIFFLEDRLKREPNSEHSVDGETVKFRSFDFWFWRLPAEPALAARLSIWRDEAVPAR